MTNIQTTIKISHVNMGDTITWYERGRPQKAHVQHVVHNEHLTYMYPQGKALAVEFDSEFDVIVHRDIIAEPQEFGDRVNITGSKVEAKAVRTANSLHPWSCSNGCEYTWGKLNELGWVTLPEQTAKVNQWWAWDEVPEDTLVHDNEGDIYKKMHGETFCKVRNGWSQTPSPPFDFNEYAPFTEVTE